MTAVYSPESSTPSLISLHPKALITLTRWHAMVKARDFTLLEELMAAQAVFRSPLAFSPYQGPQTVSRILNAALDTFSDFHYEREFCADPLNLALEFRARVDERQVKGIDLIRFDAEGQILEFEVMVRPMSGLAKLGEHMAAKVGPYLKQLASQPVGR
jgi:SnoaL-like domain